MSPRKPKSQAAFTVGGSPADPVSAIRAAIRTLIPQGRSQIGSTATVVGMSVRTLQRRLAETGVSYSDLVDEVRLASALTLIDDRSIRLSDVARRLGYADAANFDRAFRRWTGFSPSQVRALNRQSRFDLTRKRHVGSP